jgi:hypothetical protein
MNINQEIRQIVANVNLYGLLRFKALKYIKKTQIESPRGLS